jgi:thiamine-phosphate pyrophosphorylase
MKRRIKGLYAITPDWEETPRLLAQVEAALKGGIALLQYRNKVVTPDRQAEQAAALLQLCRRYSVPLIVNDDVSLARQIGADGVHLGADDGDIAEARASLGPDSIIGASCYNRLELAVLAKQQGADYGAFGACFDSPTKPAAVCAPLSLFAEARQQVGLPMVAIGGIHAGNMLEPLRAGADSVAMISAIFSQGQDTQARVAGLVDKIQSLR